MSNQPRPKRSNNVDLATVGGLVGVIQEQPEAAATTWSAEVRWNGGFQSEARIRSSLWFRRTSPQNGAGTWTATWSRQLGALGNCLVVGYVAERLGCRDRDP